MTARELIKELSKMPGDIEVVFSDLEEHNEAVWLIVDDIEHNETHDAAILGAYEGWQMRH